MIALKIAGWGAYRPTRILAGPELDARLGMPDGWSEREFGISSRGIAGPEETSSMMGAEAARAALGRAGWAKGEFDVLIGACGVMEQPIPSTSILIQDRLGLGGSGIPAFDVNQTCLSFLAAFDIAAMGIALGRWRRVLIVSSDIASAGLDPGEAKAQAIFGDGAAAVAVEGSGGSGGLLAARFESYGEGHELATLRAGGTRLRVEEGYDALVHGSRFKMDSFGIFKAAARRLPKLIDTVLAEAGATRDSLAAIVCHQASGPGVEHVRRLFEPAPDRVIDIFRTTGNQIAASLPTVLAHGLDSGRIRPGDVILMLGTAAGISAGAIVLRV
ncbi:MAG TPA: 3-oxoacyl-[acyl-carrier-protein] synthase III C-terminal domain-containing protein [Allosphingosinicella sp.]|jgi:3-oxoacyl-[acyl-carrier-protein] synthase-3